MEEYQFDSYEGALLRQAVRSRQDDVRYRLHSMKKGDEHYERQSSLLAAYTALLEKLEAGSES